MKGRLIAVSSWRAIQSTANNKVCRPGLRLLAMKTSGRAAVHGVKPPRPDMVDKEIVEMEIERAKEEKEKKRKEIEDTVDSQLKNKNWETLSDSSTS